MTVVYYVLGAAVIGGGLADVFLTVLHYDSDGLMAARGYRALWLTTRVASAPLPGGLRALVRSMAAPFMVVSTLAGWLGVQILGFALLYWAGIHGGRNFSLGHLQPTFWTALYFSAASLTSLSFSDAEPTTIAFHWAAAMETLVGLAVLTLTISYLLGLYGVLQDQGMLAARLQHQSRGGNDPQALLEPHFSGGEPDGLSGLLRDLHQNLIAHYEGLLRYPIVYYFHTRRPNRSIPYIFWFVGAAAAAVRWGLPEDHPAPRNPWLPGLLEGYDEMAKELAERFLPRTPDPSGEPVSLEAFGAASAGAPTDDERLRTFLDIDRHMRELAELPPTGDPTETYHRYVEWAAFTGRGRAFVQNASRDLGLDPDVLYDDPTREQF